MYKRQLGGFNSEQYEITDTNGYTRNIAMDMLALQISVMLIALIGTVVDIAIAITSSIYEIHQAGGAGDFGRLAASGFIASRAILNTSIHTIFYIYIAEYLTLMIQYVDEYSLVRLVNSKSFCQEFLSISISGLGCCLIVPAATPVSYTHLVAAAVPFIILSMRNGIAFATILRYHSFFEIARFLTGSRCV